MEQPPHHCGVSAEQKAKQSFAALRQTCAGGSSGQGGLTSPVQRSGHRSAPEGSNGVLGLETFHFSITHKSKCCQLRADLLCLGLG